MEQKIIATVGGHQITEAEVEAFIHSLPREQQAYAAHPDFRKQCEEQLIAVYAFAKYGEEEKIDETEEFKNVMENARKDILAQMAMRKLFATVNVTDDEIKEYYEANKSKYSKGASVHAKHILVDNEEKCTELLNAITSGEKVFEDVAKESSTCPSGANGGDLGEFGRGQMVKEFEDAAFAAAPEVLRDDAGGVLDRHVPAAEVHHRRTRRDVGVTKDGFFQFTHVFRSLSQIPVLQKPPKPSARYSIFSSNN